MSNKNFTLTYDELLLLLKDAYRNGYSTYEMADAGLERYDDDGYARWVLLGMENKQRKEIIKKWEESGLLDGLTEMDKDHPMLKVLEANGKQGINELPDVKPMMEKNKQEKEQIMDTMCQQLKMEVNASETQKYYKSKEVQDLDNPTDVVDEYESMENLEKMLDWLVALDIQHYKTESFSDYKPSGNSHFYLKGSPERFTSMEMIKIFHNQADGELMKRWNYAIADAMCKKNAQTLYTIQNFVNPKNWGLLLNKMEIE